MRVISHVLTMMETGHELSAVNRTSVQKSIRYPLIDTSEFAV